MLPMLRSEQRPSKHVIVDASISHHKAQEARSHQAARVIQDLITERDDLLREVNSLRSLCQPSGCAPRQPRPIDPAAIAMLAEKGTAASAGKQAEISASVTLQQTNIPPTAPGVVSLPVETPQAGLPPLPQPTYNADDWSWSSPLKPQPTTFPLNSVGVHSVIWNASPDMVTTTPPKDVELGYDPNTSHLIDDSAFFWTQHPNLSTTTPPRDTDLPYGTNTSAISGVSSLLWPQNMAISPTTPSSNVEQTSNDQPFQSANSFSNPESLSI